MSLPYKVQYKLPLEYLTLQDWNNFVQNLLFLNQYGSAKLLQYYKNGNFQNLNDVIAEYLYVSALKVMGYNVLHNLSKPLAYIFGEGNQQPFESMSQRPTVSFPYSIPFEFIQFYPLSELPNYKLPIFPVEKLQVQLAQVSKQLQLLIPKIVSKIVTPTSIAGTQFQFSGTANVQTLIEDYLNPTYLQTWREIIIQNLGTSAVQINNSIYLMPKNCLKITASSPSEIQLTAQTPTLLSEEIEFIGTPITTYTITITNNQTNPTPSPFQQLLNLNLSSILSSSSQLLNLEFCLDANCNTPLYAWIESYNTNLSTVYIWVNLPTSIPANSSITIYMFVRNSIQYPYTGIAPQLTSVYAQYDNGGNVFLFYDNFAGTSLNTNKWSYFTGSGASISVNNGITVNGDSSYAGIITLSGFNPTTTIADIYVINASGKWPVISMTNGNSDSSNGYFALWSGTAGSYYYGNYITGISGSGGFTWNYPAILSQSWQSSSQEIYGSNYTYTTESFSTYSLPSSVYYGFGSLYISSSGTMTVQWFRVRALPPNNVMPSNSQPQKTIILLG